MLFVLWDGEKKSGAVRVKKRCRRIKSCWGGMGIGEPDRTITKGQEEKRGSQEKKPAMQHGEMFV